MKKILVISTLSIALGLSFLSYRQVKEGIKINSNEFAPAGMVAYAASYSNDITNEPKYSTQNSTTFQYLNLGHTLDTYRGDSVKVGIIDSGINYDHEDFMASGSTKVKGDSKRYSYENSGWLYYKASQHGYSYIDDTLGHGTNVAATVAAAVNSVGGLGLAPNVELYVYKVTNSNNGYEFGAIQLALNDAVTLGLDVINMSFQSYEHAVSYNGSTMGASSGCSTILSSYLNSAYNAGITLVGAAGNYNTSEPSYPGSNNHVINVGSLNSNGTSKAGFSNYGSTIDLVAPGYVYVADEASNTAYTNTQGTSFSAPLVTAAIALYKQKNPSATPDQIESALYASCDSIDDSGSQYTNWAGHGSLNVARFLGVVDNAPSEIVINNPEVENEELSLEIGDIFDLDWTVNGNGTFDDSVSFYALEDNGVLSVDSNGRITALKEGTDYVIIESNADSSIYTQVYVTVTSSSSSTIHVTGVSLNKSTLSLQPNGSETLTATVTPSNATNKSVTWTSSNTNVATVTSSGVVTVKSTATAGQTATITATTTDGGYTATCTVTVEAAPQSQTLTITRSSFTTSGGYAWYDWTQSTSDSVSISGKADLYTTTTTSMQFNKSKGNKVAALFNTTAIPGSITKIEASSYQTTVRSWTAYVTSTACSGSGSALTFGSNKLTIGSASPAVGSLTFFGTSSAGYSYFCIQENDSSASFLSEVKITYTPKSLSSIAVKTAPSKTTYEAGECFDPTGLVITATYSDNTTSDISYASASSSFSFTPSTSTTLTTSNTSVSISYGGKTCSQAITVNAAKALSSISISGFTTSFVEGDTFAFGGTVTAHYSDSTTENVTANAIFSGYDMTLVDNQTVTVSYTYKGTQKTVIYNITVSAGTLSSIAVFEQTTTYQKGYTFSFDGVCTATFANGYQKEVTPTSVSSPDMTTGGNKTVTVSYTYNGKTVTTTYEITVNAYRTVMEASELEGTITWPSSATASINGSVTGLSAVLSGRTNYESSSIRLGTSNGGGTITISASIAIKKVKITAKYYSSNYSSAVLKVEGQSVTPLTSGYSDYIVTLSSAKDSFAILTENSNSRINIQNVTVYATGPETDIGQSEDCIGLETFINTYMHMDYVDSLGYCKDSEHHYYSTAKTAFNNLNNHQRSLFVSNSAYSVEYARLSAWASFNGESLNENNQFSASSTMNSVTDNNNMVIIAIASLLSISLLTYAVIYHKRKREE